MISIIGGAVLVICAFLYGLEKSRAEKNSLVLTEALCAFVTYIGQQIVTFRTPLPRIYEEYYDERLENEGFFEILREDGLWKALLSVKQKLPKEVYSEMERFSRSVGAGYEKGQADLCAYTVQRLEKVVLERRENLPSKLRMYRLLPMLLALSLVILFL